MKRVRSTPYIEWAKLKSGAKYNLATSGLAPVSMEDIGGFPPDAPLAGPNSYGYAPLLDRIAAHHGVAASRVVTATGCSMANFLALAAMIEPGDEVLIERPTYEPILLAAAHLGASIARFERRASDGFRVDADEVIAAMTPRTRVIVLANLHNPSSEIVGQEALRRIGDAAERAGARVLVDEIYLDAVFDGRPPSCVHLGPAFVSTSSLTKVYGLAPLRCGWILADEPLAARAWRLNDLYGNVAPFLMDWISERAFEHLPSLRSRSRALLDENRSVFSQWAAHRDDLAFTCPAWGTTVCVRAMGVEADVLVDTLRSKYEVSVVPGRFFELPDYLRVSLCCETDVLKEGLARIAAALDHHARQVRQP